MAGQRGEPSGGGRAGCRRWTAALVVALAATAPAGAESSGATVFAARPASGEIRVDGVLDEPAWAEAATIPLAFETEPGENLPAPVATTCHVLFAAKRLYVGCRAEDPEPGAIRARLSDRDTAFDDDFVGIRLDPFLDRRRAFEFYVNPLGVQMDLFRDDLGNDRFGENEDESWDAIWDSAGRITATGYEVELAIPFSSLRFPRTAGEQRWGVSFARVYPRRDRTVLASEPEDRNRNCAVCQFSTLEGLAAITPGRNLELDPTVTVQRVDRRNETSGELETGDVDTEPGLTLTWGITPDVVLSAAANPDFSQVEADALELDVNQQFAIFYPERRPFFLEGADFFSTPFPVVFTRNVADPDWGLKTTGKVGANAFGVFVAEDARTSLLVPGSQRSELVELPGRSTDAAARYRRDIGRGSALGLIGTSRRSDDYENQVAGFDGLTRFSDADSVRFQLLGSRTTYPEELAGEPGQTPRELDDHALFLTYNHNSRAWRLAAEFEDVGRDFRSDLGFMPQVDYRYGKALAERTWWAAPAAPWISFSFGLDRARADDQAGEPLERLDEAWIIFHGRRELELFVQAADRERTLAGITFDERYVEGHVEVRPTRALQLELEWNVGDSVDLAHLRPADQVQLAPAITWTPGRHLNATLELQQQRLDVDAGHLFTARLTELRLVWQFDLRSFVRVILQHRDLERNPALYAEPVEERDQELFSQLLYSYRLNPQTVLYLGYSDTQIETDAIDRMRLDRTLFVKLGYAWLP